MALYTIHSVIKLKLRKILLLHYYLSPGILALVLLDGLDKYVAWLAGTLSGLVALQELRTAQRAIVELRYEVTQLKQSALSQLNVADAQDRT